MFVDDLRRVYVADCSAKAIIVLNGMSGQQLAKISVAGEGNLYGVVVTRRGQIVVSMDNGKRGAAALGWLSVTGKPEG